MSVDPIAASADSMRLADNDERVSGGALLRRALALPVAAARSGAGTVAAGDVHALQRLPMFSAARWKAIPRRRRLVYSSLCGICAAAVVGYLTSQNPDAAPAGGAVILRILIILSLVGAGVYAQTSELQTRMGGLLVAAGLLASVWLLNGSSNEFAFTLGMLVAPLAPAVVAYLMLVHPTGRLRATADRRLLIGVGGVLIAASWLTIFASVQPPVHTPLLRCAPNCPDNALFLWSIPDALSDMLTALAFAAWLALAWGTAVLLRRHARTASGPTRRSLNPVGIAAFAQAAMLTAFVISARASAPQSAAFGAAYVDLSVAVPLAILLGLGLERLYMGRALASVVNKLARSNTDPQRIIGDALRDPSLTIAYRRPGVGSYVDSAGRPVTMPPPDDRAMAWIGGDRGPVAAVLYDAELRDQERFLEAVGDAALMRLENARLEAELRASTANLMASRIRLVETAHAERRRIERDLHDGVQQRLVALRIKLESAAQTVHEDPERGEQMVAAIGRQMDEALEELRALARGIYPSLLQEQGVVEALKSAGRRSPTPVAVRGTGIRRYPEDIEVAVYFCCLEALQNVAKHGGEDATAGIRLWQDGEQLCFEVRDSGVGFEPAAGKSGSGLVNMRDRIEAVGGTLRIGSALGAGTSVRGSVPLSDGRFRFRG